MTNPFPFLSTPTICLLYHSVPHKHITFRSLWPPIFSDGQTREQTPSTRHFCFLIWTRIARGRYSGTLALLCHMCSVYYHVPHTFARNSTFIKALTMINLCERKNPVYYIIRCWGRKKHHHDVNVVGVCVCLFNLKVRWNLRSRDRLKNSMEWYGCYVLKDKSWLGHVEKISCNQPVDSD